MSKRTTKEEKLKIILDKFHESKEFFLLADLQKEMPKTIANQLKELLQELVSDNLISSDKIGTSTYYWSFPSQTYSLKTERLKILKDEIDALEVQYQNNEEKRLEYEKEMAEVDETERKTAMQKLESLESKHSSIKTELEELKDFDPKLIEEIENHMSDFKEAANRWTDNIFSLESFCVKKFGMDKAAFRKAFGIPSDFDNI
ncbi:Meiotic nuclear division protein 1 [Entomophthora muscae]|uniref:Meiotic nuclear division protein 1 n=2 Tax=Entomophthora muscae TaxID=34485 RepID=A0ACC2URM4_9FUNG|nr:Meiotic nuclear division protein 1 [Entomophthora muscae]